MDLLNLGSQSRKTGIKPKKNLRKDKYNMEDIDDFFDDESGEDEPDSRNRNSSSYRPVASSQPKTSYKPRESSIIPRMINFTDAEAEKFDLSPIMIEKEKKNSLKSPLSEQEPASPKIFVGEDSSQSDSDDVDVQESHQQYGHEGGEYDLPQEQDDAFSNNEPDQGMDDGYGYDDLNNDFLDSAAQDDTAGGANESHGDGYESEDVQVSKRSIASLTKNMALGKTTNSKRIRSKPSVASSTPKAITVRPSPLPSPPPDGLRRSKRTRIQPLAFWRNERIVYSRSNGDDDDPDTTLINDIRKIPLQEIKEIIHVPQTEEPKRNTSKSSSKSPKLSQSKRSKRSSSAGNLNVKKSKKVATVDEGYDYESDPEVEGSEWFKENILEIPIFTKDETEKMSTVALTQNFSDRLEDPYTAEGSIDNYRVARVFDDDPRVKGALLEIPREGFKSSKDSSGSAYMFHVIFGLFEVNIANHTFVVTRGCSFHVPIYNTYGITNIGNSTGKIFCVEAVLESEEDKTM